MSLARIPTFAIISWKKKKIRPDAGAFFVFSPTRGRLVVCWRYWLVWRASGWFVHSCIHPCVDGVIHSHIHTVIDSFATRCLFIDVPLIRWLSGSLVHSSNYSLTESSINTLVSSLVGALVDSPNRSSLIDDAILGWLDWRGNWLIYKLG